MTEKWLKLILCVSIVIFLLPLSVPSISPINNEFNDNSRDYITSENQAINTVEKSTINHNELDDDGLNSNADAGSQLIIQPVPASEIPIFANNDPVIDTRASRNVRVNHVNTGSNDPNAGATPFSANNSILVGSLKGNELHWFYTQALKSPSIGKIYNFTLSPTLLSSFVNDDWLLVRIYMHWNFDEDWEDKIDDPTKIDDKEMILLHQESYDWSSSTHTVSFAHTSDAVDYYVCVEGQPKDSESTLSYELTTTWYKITPPTDGIYDNENNYKLEKSTLISPAVVIIPNGCGYITS